MWSSRSLEWCVCGGGERELHYRRPYFLSRITASVTAKTNQYIKPVFTEKLTVEELYDKLTELQKVTLGIKTANKETLDQFLNQTMDDLYHDLGHKAKDMFVR
jgi:hypothetical protein